MLLELVLRCTASYSKKAYQAQGDEVSLRPTATVRLDFLTNQSEGTDTDEPSSSYIPETYILEPRLRIDAYRIISALSTVDLVDSYVDELIDRFGRPPDEVTALLQEARIRCLTEEANFDLIETRGNELCSVTPEKEKTANALIMGCRSITTTKGKKSL